MHISRRTFHGTVSIFIAIAWAFQSGFVRVKVTTQKESHIESSLRERDDCDVNKFSISLVCGLREGYRMVKSETRRDAETHVLKCEPETSVCL